MDYLLFDTFTMSSADGDTTILAGELESQCSIKLDNDNILDMKVQSFTEVNIQEEDDEELSYIPGSRFLSNGDLVLCDYYNHKLKLLDRDFKMKKSLTLPGAPWDIAIFNEQESVVCLPRLMQLQFVQMLPDMDIGHEIALGAECLGIDVFEEEIYTFVETQIWKLDKTGNIKSKINLPEVVTDPTVDYFRLSRSGSVPRIYLTDRDWAKVLCLNIDGSVAFQYEHEDLKGMGGTYVDLKGNCFVCDTDSNNIVVITADGKEHTILQTEKKITRPTSVAFRPEDGTLVVGGRRLSRLCVLKLAK